ncbi:hypothetical protein AHiyo8_pI68000 (plasmid) [Arthrobacter sp. Hiyo8]|nr:hypothetical protein AHiyo8_pI68000 [Arthrobacter sp. Hiyo8]
MKSRSRFSHRNNNAATYVHMNEYQRLELDEDLTEASLSGVPHHEWVSLESNDRVTVYRGWESRFSGTVDVVAQDGSVFWVWATKGVGGLLSTPKTT